MSHHHDYVDEIRDQLVAASGKPALVDALIAAAARSGYADCQAVMAGELQTAPKVTSTPAAWPPPDVGWARILGEAWAKRVLDDETGGAP